MPLNKETNQTKPKYQIGKHLVMMVFMESSLKIHICDRLSKWLSKF